MVIKIFRTQRFLNIKFLTELYFKIHVNVKILRRKYFASNSTHFQLISFPVQLKLRSMVSRTSILTISKSFLIYIDSCHKDKDVRVFKTVAL